MKVFTCPKPDEVGKFYGVIHAFPTIWQGSILDVGSRSGNFKEVLCEYNPGIRYIGLDLYPPADIIANLEKGLPFGDKTFDAVVALDVLEHTDDIHRAFNELCRITRQFVVINLPNAYEMKGRIKFLLGRSLSRKYGLPSEPPRDRHHWLFSFSEARAFVRERAQRCGFEVIDEGCLIGPRRTAFGIGRLMVALFPNVMSPWYLALLQRR